jgi:transcriptional regulator with XRE-family HTH domain
MLTQEETIDLLKKKFDLKTDSEVATMLGLKKQHVSAWRSGKRDLPKEAIVEAWDKVNYAIPRDALLWLMGGVGEKIRKMDNRRAMTRAEKKNKPAPDDQETT